MLERTGELYYDDDFSGTHGFWRGMLTGLILAALTAAVLAYFFPPLIFAPPVIAPEATTAPGGAEGPDGASGPAPVQTDAALPDLAPVPSKAGGPGREESPSLFEAAPLAAPEILGDAPASKPAGQGDSGNPARPDTSGALPSIAPAPAISSGPGIGSPPVSTGISQPSAPEVFDGGASGSPSLVPQAQQ